MADEHNPTELGELVLGCLESLPNEGEFSFRRISTTPGMFSLTLRVTGYRVKAFTGQDPTALLLEAGRHLAKLAGA